MRGLKQQIQYLFSQSVDNFLQGKNGQENKFDLIVQVIKVYQDCIEITDGFVKEKVYCKNDQVLKSNFLLQENQVVALIKTELLIDFESLKFQVVFEDIILLSNFSIQKYQRLLTVDQLENGEFLNQLKNKLSFKKNSTEFKLICFEDLMTATSEQINIQDESIENFKRKFSWNNQQLQ